jgi:hypothetical protein
MPRFHSLAQSTEYLKQKQAENIIALINTDKLSGVDDYRAVEKVKELLDL